MRCVMRERSISAPSAQTRPMLVIGPSASATANVAE